MFAPWTFSPSGVRDALFIVKRRRLPPSLYLPTAILLERCAFICSDAWDSVTNIMTVIKISFWSAFTFAFLFSALSTAYPSSFNARSGQLEPRNSQRSTVDAEFSRGIFALASRNDYSLGSGLLVRLTFCTGILAAETAIKSLEELYQGILNEALNLVTTGAPAIPADIGSRMTVYVFSES